jgi:hypothetical protein
MRAAPRWLTELFEVVTVGFPFCAFKAVVGLWLLSRGATVPGVLLLGLAGLDAVINAVNFGALLVLRRRAVNACTISLVLTRVSRASEDLGNSIDLMLSCALVAAMVALGAIPSFPEDQLRAWNWAVVLNVLGAGLSRLGASVSQGA